MSRTGEHETILVPAGQGTQGGTFRRNHSNIVQSTSEDDEGRGAGTVGVLAVGLIPPV